MGTVPIARGSVVLVRVRVLAGYGIGEDDHCTRTCLVARLHHINATFRNMTPWPISHPTTPVT